MPEADCLVINTGPLIALVAAWGHLKPLQVMYHRVLVPFEVSQEILAGGITGFAVSQFREASWLEKHTDTLKIMPFLANSLDEGEAAVIQLALNENIRTVCIDEAAGRRIARLNGLLVTGSIGVLLRARRENLHPVSVRTAIERMKRKGIWLSDRVISFALKQAGETGKEN